MTRQMIQAMTLQTIPVIEMRRWGHEALDAGSRSQRGAYTIAVVAVLSLITVVATYTLNRATLDAIRITNNGLETSEAFNAAETALAAAAATSLAGVTFDSNGLAAGSTGQVTFAHTVGSDTVNRVFDTAITLQIPVADGPYVRIYTTASGSRSSATVSQLAVRNPVLDALNNFDTPPLVVSDCLSSPGASGPNITPAASLNQSFAGKHVGTAVCTSNLTSEFQDASNPSVPESVVTGVNNGDPDLWPLYFNKTRIEVAAMVDTTSTLHWVDGSTTNKLDLDDFPSSPTSPAVLIVDNCTKLGGTFYGVVFMQPNPANPGTGSCSGNGWGNTEIHGALALNGEVTKLNANVELIAWGEGSGFPAPPPANVYGDDMVLVPGTWTDTVVAP